MSHHFEQMPKAQLLQRITEAHNELDGVLARVDEETANRPGASGELSIKDVVAHIAVWEEMVGDWIAGGLRNEAVVRFRPGFEMTLYDNDKHIQAVVDRLNAHIHEEHHDLPLSDVLDRLYTAQQKLVDLVEEMSQEEINDPNRFAWYEGEPVWTSIAGNSFSHYFEHIEEIEEWLAQGT